MHLSTLEDWLRYIDTVHGKDMDFGLERVRLVAEKLSLLTPTPVVVTVGGTNGKGSTVAALEAMYQMSGYQVGVFNSPVLLKHNEYVRVNGVNPSDAAFCDAYDRVESARGDVTLTPFEFHALAALLIFQTHELDVLLLEVGLGGRLDAVNIIDADVAIITSIDFDHMDYLGDTLDAIAFEKAGIARAGKPMVCGEMQPPMTLVEYTTALNSPLMCLGKAFHVDEQEDGWSWSDEGTQFHHLPLPRLLLQNVSLALKAITLLQDRLSVNEEAIRKAMSTMSLPGRFDIKRGAITEIHDVAHNPAAVRLLAKKLSKHTATGKTHAVFSMLADKDISACLRAINAQIDHWYVAPLQSKRAATLQELIEKMKENGVSQFRCFETMSEAYHTATKNAAMGDTLVCFGSFLVVNEVMLN